MQKGTLFADLRRSAPDSEKHTLFCVFVFTHVNTYDLCEPPGAKTCLKIFLIVIPKDSGPAKPSCAMTPTMESYFVVFTDYIVQTSTLDPQVWTEEARQTGTHHHRHAKNGHRLEVAELCKVALNMANTVLGMIFIKLSIPY